MKLSAGSIAASTAITAIPDDIATPVATQLAELSKAFLLILSVLYIEKFLLLISSTLVFKWLIPISCAIFVFGQFKFKESCQFILGKIIPLSLALLFVVPISVELSQMVEKTYTEHINEVVESAETSSTAIQDSITGTENTDKSKNAIEKIFDNLKNTGDIIANGATKLIDYLENLLNRFIESVAIMLVVSCVIPLCVFAFFIWFIKILFNYDIKQKYLDAKQSNRKLVEHNEAA